MSPTFLSTALSLPLKAFTLDSVESVWEKNREKGNAYLHHEFEPWSYRKIARTY